MSAGADRVDSRIEAYGPDGGLLATFGSAGWSAVSADCRVHTSGGTTTLLRRDLVVVKILQRPRFHKVVSADFRGPDGQRVLIGTDGGLRLLTAGGRLQVEVADCDFLGEAHFAEVPAGSLGRDHDGIPGTVDLHADGVTYTTEARGVQILNSEFLPSGAAAMSAVSAGFSMN